MHTQKTTKKHKIYQNVNNILHNEIKKKNCPKTKTLITDFLFQ